METTVEGGWVAQRACGQLRAARVLCAFDDGSEVVQPDFKGLDDAQHVTGVLGLQIEPQVLLRMIAHGAVAVWILRGGHGQVLAGEISAGNRRASGVTFMVVAAGSPFAPSECRRRFDHAAAGCCPESRGNGAGQANEEVVG